MDISDSPAAYAGYSGTPLAKKLGIVQGSRVLCIGAPEEYERLLKPLPEGVVFTDRFERDVDLVHVFVTEQWDLVERLATLRSALNAETPVWVSWPKKASKVPTTVTEDTIRDAALPIGYVDIKVCAISEVWSGLKLVVRKALR